MTRFKEFGKYFYISIILLLCYIPLFVLAVFSFNKTSDKGFVSFFWNGFSWDAYQNLFSSEIMLALVNSIIIALLCSIIVVTISLTTVYSVWKQKNKVIKSFQSVSNNISMINPDVIIGISLGLFFTLSFGALSSGSEGLLRTIIGHSVMTLPYGILIMYPKSEKFNRSQFEASQDLGYSKFKTWFRTYLVHMLQPIIFTIVVTFVFSFDDFIVTSITSNAPTLGTELYQGQFRSWALALGSILLVSIIIGNVFLYLKNSKKGFSLKKEKKYENK